MNDVWRELEERLKQKAKTRFELQQTFEEEHVTAKELWVRLEDVLSILQQLKQKICEVIDQYIEAYPLDTPEDRQVSKVLDEIRQELLKNG